jgi:anti-sigma-K factor RskA
MTSNPDHARFAEWDAAYVLGALSPAERREFEDHLDDCEKCRAAVSELSALPGLLGRIDDARAFAVLEEAQLEEAQLEEAQLEEAQLERDPVEGDPDAAAGSQPGPPADLVARIQNRERRDRIRRRIGMGAALAAAAAIAAVLALVLPPVFTPAVQPAFAAELTPTDSSTPVDASVALTTVPWGTRIEMDCRYHPGPPGPDGGYVPVSYALWVVDQDGAESSLSTWTVTQAGTVEIAADTALALSDIARVEVRSESGVQVLLQTTVGSA